MDTGRCPSRVPASSRILLRPSRSTSQASHSEETSTCSSIRRAPRHPGRSSGSAVRTSHSTSSDRSSRPTCRSSRRRSPDRRRRRSRSRRVAEPLHRRHGRRVHRRHDVLRARGRRGVVHDQLRRRRRPAQRPREHQQRAFVQPHRRHRARRRHDLRRRVLPLRGDGDHAACSAASAR